MSAEAEDDRMVQDVLPPPRHALTEADLYKGGNTPQLDVLVKHLHREGRVALGCRQRLIQEASRLFRKEPNLLKLYDPITVCGDVHGQFFDLLRLLEAGGDPKDTQYLFLGDYVDRGCFSTEVVFYMFALKINYPKSFFMLRGNHECRHLTSFFNFKDECLYKYDVELYNQIMDSFDCLPISATINKKFLCLHGGLSPDIQTLADIHNVDRFREVPREGPFCDLLWADPVDEKTEDENGPDGSAKPSGKPTSDECKWFSYNETRQCSYVFGEEATAAFLKKNSLTAIIRAHEAQYEGYRMSQLTDSGIPRVITIFSAPNYCDVYKNKGACLKIDNELLNIRQFNCSPHPYYLPNFMDVFAWSLPFVAEKVTDMLANVVTYGDSDDDVEEESEPKPPMLPPSSSKVIRQRGGVLKDKVLAITKLVRMYKVLREETDLVVQLKQLTPNKKLPLGALSEGRASLQKKIDTFQDAKVADAENEKMPPDTSGAKAKPLLNRDLSRTMF